MLTSICGINWGDEGKGRMVDLLSRRYDVVCRYQGGNNAGHTVINEKGKFILIGLPVHDLELKDPLDQHAGHHDEKDREDGGT